MLFFAKNHFPTQNLLSDAKFSLSDTEMGEDVVEGVLGGDGDAGELAEEVENVAQVFGNEVGGKTGCEGGMDGGERVVGLT